MTHRDFMHFLIAVEEVDSLDLALKETGRLISARGIDHFCLFRQSGARLSPETPIMASSWPEAWTGRYLKRHIFIDPTLRYLPQARQGYSWQQALDNFKGSRIHKRMEEMIEDARSFGLSEGAVFPVHSRFGLAAALSIGGRNCDLSPSEMTLFSAVAARLFWRMSELSGQAERPARQAKDVITLTPRSLEVLMLLADGMTSQEISARLNVSSHTVDWHFSNIQQKLQTRNRHQTVALAIRMGLIA